MSNSVHSVQSAIDQERTQQSVQPPRTEQQRAQSEPVQDRVTLSQRPAQEVTSRR